MLFEPDIAMIFSLIQLPRALVGLNSAYFIHFRETIKFLFP
jgi:hypothetical protein